MKATKLIYLFLILTSFLQCSSSDYAEGGNPDNGSNTAISFLNFNKNYVFLNAAIM